MSALAANDYRGCVRQPEPALDDVVRIGGSHAQRQLSEDTFIGALTRGGKLVRARTMLERRLQRRPSPRDARWLAAAIG